MTTVIVIVFFIVWFLLGGTPSTEPGNEPSVAGPCRGSVYGMIYQYDSSGKCVPTRCESGYTRVGGQCIFDGSDTSNLVLPSYNNTSWSRIGRVGWRLGKMRF